ncbi:MAG: glucose 1-dehydrogenase [Mariniblastus sp.]|nr:glucose 1-dehydrogenase [Mariniblastus sp.]
MNSNPFDLTGKTALVTGASRGLGLGFAKTLARAGANIAITSRDVTSLEGPAAELKALGAEVQKIELNVRDPNSIHTAVADVISHYGRIDILMNNAGCNVRKPALDVEWEDWNQVLDTNLRGAFFVAQQVAKHMAKEKYGRIINIGSVTCVAGYAGLGPYGASRGGTKQLTMSLAHDWGKHGITVNCLAPGWFKTAQNKVMYEQEGWVDYLCERIPLGRPGSPGDLEGALLLLASDASAYITGQTLLVDGGISVGAVRATLEQ